MTDGSKGDYDSDTILITDHPLLIEVAERNSGVFKVPTNLTTSVKTCRHYTDNDKADLDVKTSVNQIGTIVNLSQSLNSLMWDRLYHGESIESCMELYYDICKLAVLSNVEIDRAKKEFVINSTTELNLIKDKYKIFDGSQTVKPYFFKMITTENGYALSDHISYKYFHTSMDYLQTILNRFKFTESRGKKRDIIPFMDIVRKPPENVQQGYYYAQRDKIIERIRTARDETRNLFGGYDEMSPLDKETVRSQAWEIKQSCIEEIEKMTSSHATMYLVLRELDKPQFKDVARYVFEVLFGRPDKAFFTMIQESREPVYTLIESEIGDIELFGFHFSKINIGTNTQQITM